MRLAFIGGGVMGEAMIAGALRNGLAKANEIAACDLLTERREHLAKAYGIPTFEAAAAALEGAGLAVLAVKPQEFAAAARGLKVRSDQTVMSIMAGVRMETIRDALKHDAIVRAIPNTPAQIGEGMTVWTASDAVLESAREAVRGVLAVLGQELYVSDEKYVDMATAVSSSGPAYVFLIIEAFIDAAVHIGFRRDAAERLVIQTILGSTRYAQATGRHPAELRNQVTSPGGTTAEGLLVLEEAGLRAAFTQAIEAAYEKAKSLGG